jgi:hypothetical protein
MVKSIQCPNCGGQVELRGLGQSVSAVCINCLSIIDTTSPELRIIQQFQVSERVRPLIPLGTRGKLHGDPYEVIGFQTRQILVGGIPYEWREYVLFNPYKGFRYLSEYNNHWNDIKPLTSIPEGAEHGGRPAVRYLNQTFRHFQTARAETTYVMGEFPWKVETGEAATVSDYVAPPLLLSCERTATEANWSLGEYRTPEQIQQAFGLKQNLPASIDVFANQPSPHADTVRSYWQTAVTLMIVLAFVMLASSLFMAQKEFFRQSFTFTSSTEREPSLVTRTFDITGRPSNVEVTLRTDLDNNWAYFSMALINEQTGQAYDFGREVSYYHGRDSDGNWTEGAAQDRILIPAIPAGRYYLRIEPELGPKNLPGYNTMSYEVRLRRDVPYNLPFMIGFLLLLIPPVWATIRSASFESRRWQESDYAGGGSDEDSDSSGDDDE